MERTASSTTGQEELITQVAEQSETAALEEAAQSEARVADVGAIQKKKVRGLFAEGGLMDEALMTEVDQKIDEQQQERNENMNGATDIHVRQDDGDGVVGDQHDGTRKIRVVPRMITDPDKGPVVVEHEKEHRRQQHGVPVPLREWGSIKAGGSLDGLPPEYIAHHEEGERNVKELNEAGEDGERVVLAASRSVKAHDEMQQKLFRARMKKVMKQPEHGFALSA